MSNEKNLPYAVVCGGVNIDIGAHSFAPLRDRDSNPGRVELSLGGVGRNIAHNMRLLGVPTYLLTAVGGDSRASQVEESCKELGIDLSHALRVPDGRTSTYVFVGDSDGDMAVAVSDMEICEKLTPDYFASQKELLDGAAAVVVDANLPRKSIAYLVEHCAAPLFVDPVSTVKAEKLQGLLSHVHTLKPNRIEAELLSGVKITDNATLHQAAQALLDQGVQRVFLSLGGDGVFAAQQGETHLEPICKAEMRNATGAGDAMMASLVWSFLAGRDLAESCAAGTAAAHHGEEQEAGAAQHSQVEQDLHPGDGLLQGGVIVLHGRGRVGCVVGIDILLDVLDKHIGVGQLVAHRHRAVIVSGCPHGRGGGGEHVAQQTAGGLCGSGGTCGFGQLLLALLQRQGDDAGVAVQRKGCDLIVLKVVHHSRVAHGGAAGTAVAGAQHRPDHQNTGQCQRQDQGIKARSFRLQKGSTPVLIRFCYA